MKKIFFIMILALNSFCLSCQTHEQNQQKYWIYRDRLLEKFMHVDFDLYAKGSCLPAKRINANNKIMAWGDCTIQLATYIQTLATEYALLNYYGFDTIIFIGI